MKKEISSEALCSYLINNYAQENPVIYDLSLTISSFPIWPHKNSSFTWNIVSRKSVIRPIQNFQHVLLTVHWICSSSLEKIFGQEFHKLLVYISVRFHFTGVTWTKNEFIVRMIGFLSEHVTLYFNFQVHNVSKTIHNSCLWSLVHPAISRAPQFTSEVNPW